MLLSSDKGFSASKYFPKYTKISNANMKVFLILLVSVVGLAKAEFDSLCTSPGTYLVPHPTQCSKFIQCVSGIGVVQTCLDNKWFDKVLLICRPQDVAQCAVVPSTDVPGYVIEICSSMEVGQTIPAVECNKYYNCYELNAFELTCPAGEHYSRAYSACMNPLLAGCRALNTMCVDEYSGFQFPSLTCENYYVCDDDLMPELQSCPSGLYFNAKIQNCTTPALSGCTNTADVTTPAPGGGIIGMPFCTANCSGYFFPHVRCNWFYFCCDLIAYEYPCESGQYYDTKLKYCIQDTNHVCVP